MWVSVMVERPTPKQTSTIAATTFREDFLPKKTNSAASTAMRSLLKVKPMDFHDRHRGGGRSARRVQKERCIICSHILWKVCHTNKGLHSMKKPGCFDLDKAQAGFQGCLRDLLAQEEWEGGLLREHGESGENRSSCSTCRGHCNLGDLVEPDCVNLKIEIIQHNVANVCPCQRSNGFLGELLPFKHALQKKGHLRCLNLQPSQQSCRPLEHSPQQVTSKDTL